MKRLILVRHAQAVRGGPGLKDFDRSLDNRGKMEARLMGQRLAAQSFLPDAIVSSPAARARETCEIMAAEIGFPTAKIDWEPAIYEAEAGDLLKILNNLDSSRQSVFLVGHNPGITDLANLVARAGIAGMPTCGVVGVEFAAATIDQWSDVGIGCGRIFYNNSPQKPSG